MSQRFDRFTERAKKVLVLAQVEAKQFGHNYIGSEHLLLGLIGEGEGIAAKVLSNLGVELNRARSAVEFIIGRGEPVVTGDIGLTPRAKKVIELAVEDARRLNHNYIGTEHLLLGLVREGEGIAAGVLESLGVDLTNVRTQIIAIVSRGAAGAGIQTAGRPAPAAAPSVTAGSAPRFSTSGAEVLACRLDPRASETLDLLLAAGAFGSRGEAADRLLGAALEVCRAGLERLATTARTRAGAGEERGQPPPAGPTTLRGTDRDTQPR